MIELLRRRVELVEQVANRVHDALPQVLEVLDACALLRLKVALVAETVRAERESWRDHYRAEGRAS